MSMDIKCMITNQYSLMMSSLDLFAYKNTKKARKCGLLSIDEIIKEYYFFSKRSKARWAMSLR